MSGRWSGQVAAINPGISFLRSSNDEHRQGTVMRPVDPVPSVGHHQALAAGYRSSVHWYAVDVGRCGRWPCDSTWRCIRATAAVTVPVNLHQPASSSSSPSSVSSIQSYVLDRKGRRIEWPLARKVRRSAEEDGRLDWVEFNAPPITV